MSARVYANEPFWTQEQCFRALYAWVREHGRVPSENGDWRSAGHNRPSGRSCHRIFGSWSRFILMAGLEPRKAGMPPRWTRDRVAEWLLDQLMERGQWPTVTEMRTAAAGKRPSYCTVLRLFGSYSKAKRYAGWDGRCKQCNVFLGRRARASQFYCTTTCGRAARAAVKSAACSPVSQASARVSCTEIPGGTPIYSTEVAA